MWLLMMKWHQEMMKQDTNTIHVVSDVESNDTGTDVKSTT